MARIFAHIVRCNETAVHAALAEIDLAHAVQGTKERLQNLLEQASLGPSLEPVEGGAGLGVFRGAGDVLVAAAGPEAVHEAVEDLAVVLAFASQAGLLGHEGFYLELALVG